MNTINQQEYEVLAAKMKTDKVFLDALRNSKTEKEIYDNYVKFGYTDLKFDEFTETFRGIIHILMKKQSENSGEGTKKLTDEELDAVVGGFNIFRFFMGLIDAVPVFGPIVATTMKGVADAVQGKWSEFAKDVIIGTLETGIGALTAGFGTEAVNMAVDGVLGTAAVSEGLAEALGDKKAFG